MIGFNWPVIIFIVFLGLGTIAGAIILQVFLSKKESVWAGLILPIISFSVSLLVVFGMLVSAFAQSGTVISGMGGLENAFILGTSHTYIIISSIIAFLFYNVPTAVFVVIYVVCKRKHNTQRALEKMSVQDL